MSENTDEPPAGDTTPVPRRRREEDSLLTEYFTHLKQIYKTPPPHWGPLPQCELIKLAMIKEKGKRHGGMDGNIDLHEKYRDIEKTLLEKSPVEMDKLFDDGTFDKDRKVILVEGAPGMGKTMLAHHYCQKWAADELSMFDAVILVPLQNLDVQSASSLADLLLIATAKHPTQITKEMVQHVARHLKNVKILLIFDGWDELSAEYRRNSFVEVIITSPQFVSPQTIILVTSRPDSSLDLHDLANRVEILGFTEHNIHEYFKKSLSTKLAHDKVESGFIKLRDHLYDYPVIRSCCYVPLNTAILVHVFFSYEQALPKTRHELFHALVLCLINRERQTRPNVRGLEGVSSLNDPNVKDQLRHICKLAYEGLMQTKAVFNQEELSVYNLPTDISTLGLLLCVEQFTLYGCRTVSYHFLHLSIQELLAAYHISQIEGDQVEVFEILLGQPRFSAVLQFYAAFTKLANQDVRNIISRREFLLDDHSPSHFGISQHPRLLLLLNCFFEAQLQDQSLYHQIISNLNSKLILDHTTLSPVDCISVGYFLASILPMTTGELTVDLSFCHITAHSMHLLLGELSKCAGTLGNILQGIASLNISYNNIGDSGIVQVARALSRNRTMRILDIRKCGITEVGMKSLARALYANTSLQELDIASNNTGDNGIVEIATSLKNNGTLEKLVIGHCGITEVGAESLSEALAVSSSLKKLIICGMTDQGIAYITRALRSNTTLEVLDIGECGITEVGMESLAEALAANSSLKQLLVPENNIGDVGIVHIAKALERNSTLEELDISGCSMTEIGAESLAEMLVKNNSLQVLVVNDNTIRDTGIVHIVRALKRNSTLKKLYIQECDLTEVGVELLIKALPTNHSLERLGLGWSSTRPNQILRKLARCLKRSALKELHISLNPRPNEEQHLSEERARDYLQSLEMGGKEFIQSQNNGRLSQFLLVSPPLNVPVDEQSQACESLKISASSINSARRGKGLPPINFRVFI